jgi:uncharacterized protein YyaL (SSP411 family)
MANRLARARSPYLLQHADNPVDWFEWGDEAFEKARREDKPIFLSIGYSTCHWCHVMAHESFEDAHVADVLNREFVSIKLDREERPDVDRVYMLFVQATTGAGGWPMSVWLTPELKPFFGGTYFPPESRWGRPGFVDLLVQLARAWKSERPKVLESAESVLGRLRQMAGADGEPAEPEDRSPKRAPVAGRDALAMGVATFAQVFDGRNGGFGGAPKFPRPAELLGLLAAHAVTGEARASQMALHTLRAMAVGGMHDHIGGGFHRYSVDAQWRVPHFEKMLYDQAQLVLAYLEAAQVSGEQFFATIAEDTLDYVMRDLTAPDGGFYSAEDADSEVPRDAAPKPGAAYESQPGAAYESQPGAAHDGEHHKREGAFYVWSAAHIDRLLGADAQIVRRRFGIEDDGNAPADPQGEFRGQNILYVAQSVEDIAARSNRSADEVVAALTRARTTMFEAREKRPRPHRDDKVIAAWNGLMIAAFARAGRQLVDSPRRQEWRAAAERAAAAVESRLWQPGRRRLLRRYRDGEAGIDAFCEDYACVVWGYLELFQMNGDGRWLDRAIELTATQTELFFDPADGGWFSTTGADPAVLLRLKEDYDGAEPSAASVAVQNLITLGRLTGEAAFVDHARRTLERYGPGLGQVARVMPLMLANAARWHSAPLEIVIAGARDSADTLALERVRERHYLPGAVTLPVPGSEDPGLRSIKPPAAMPWVAAMVPRDGKATAYVCQNFACQEPATNPDVFDQQLKDASEPRRIV